MQVGNLSTPARSRALFAVVGVLVALLIGGGLIWVALIAPQLRQATVAARGAVVMPFDLERTTHVFAPTADGGIQQVRADDPADSEQIALIRSHLQEAAQRFQQGDFGDPAAIHGAAMPGLAELEQGARASPLPTRTCPTAPNSATSPAIQPWLMHCTVGFRPS